jgi:hypothetical protein
LQKFSYFQITIIGAISVPESESRLPNNGKSRYLLRNGVFQSGDSVKLAIIGTVEVTFFPSVTHKIHAVLKNEKISADGNFHT